MTKRNITPSFYIRDIYAGQATASIERRITNRGYAVANYNARQATAIPERRRTDTRYVFVIIKTNYNIRCRARAYTRYSIRSI